MYLALLRKPYFVMLLGPSTYQYFYTDTIESMLKPRKLFLVIALIIICFFIFSFIKKSGLEKGNIFFGGHSSLYNIRLAQFFYENQLDKDIEKNKTSEQYLNYQLGRVHFIKGDLYKSLEYLKAEEVLHPNNKRVHYMQGLTYGYLHLEELAIEEFAKFIEWKPESWAARNDKAWLEFRLGKIDDALKTIEPVVHLTDNAWVQNTYGTLLMNKKRYVEAKQAYNYAKIAADTLTEKEWGKVYPGNDPRVYAAGLKGTRLSIDNNLKLLETKK